MATDKLVDFDHVTDYISREAAIEKITALINKSGKYTAYESGADDACYIVEHEVPAADVRPVPPGGIGEMSDGYHTFNGLYYQRMVLFAELVKQNMDSAWKSHRHEDGELCFGGGWFIVGIDTPKGSYTYHYEDKDWDLFDCEELPVGKHWDGHTEDDVTRLLSLPEMRPVVRERWEDETGYIFSNLAQRVYCPACKSYAYFYPITAKNFCPNCGADMREVSEDG